MTILSILIAPEPALLQKCQPVAEVNDHIRSELDDMLETMYEALGIGLAAIQVNIPKRMLVIDIARRSESDDEKTEEPDPYFMVNPEIIEVDDEFSFYEEGCLSLPSFFEEVKRPKSCLVRYLDYNGQEYTKRFEGLMATVVQHEIDHLDGILFIDHISRLKKNIILKKLKKEKNSNTT